MNKNKTPNETKEVRNLRRKAFYLETRLLVLKNALEYLQGQICGKAPRTELRKFIDSRLEEDTIYAIQVGSHDDAT